jgi:hypothetical protein
MTAVNAAGKSSLYEQDARMKKARKLPMWEQDICHELSKKVAIVCTTFMKQESCHHGNKTEDMIEARKLSLYIGASSQS